MNETINVMKSHKSIRKFDLEHPIPENEFQEILAATRQASTWMNGEFYSMIVVRDPELREAVYASAPPYMTFIKKCAELVVFVVDMHRTSLAAKMHDKPYVAQGIEPLLIGTVDTSLVGQNMLTAAESLGYGGVFIGLVREEPKKMMKALNLPDQTFPLFAIALGKPAQEPAVKPRLQEHLVVHYDTYKEPTIADLEEYDEIQTQYAGARQKQTWTEKFAHYFEKYPMPRESEELLRENHLL